MTLRDVLVDELRDLYSAENQLVKALPKMAKATSHDGLKQAFTEHLEQTKGHVERLKTAFSHLGVKPAGQHCKGMEGVIAEGQEEMQKGDKGPLRDAGIFGAALRVEHYEMAGYTTAIAIAKKLGEKQIVPLLNETLNEEKEAGKRVFSFSGPVLDSALPAGLAASGK